MKTHLLILLAGFGLMNATLHAAEKKAGPKGGKLSEISGGYVEFFVNTKRQGEILFYNKDLKAQPVGDREVAVTTGTRQKQEKLAVEKSASQFTTAPLPSGDGYYVILQVKASPDADPQTVRVHYVEEICGGCKLPEYACTCDH